MRKGVFFQFRGWGSRQGDSRTSRRVLPRQTSAPFLNQGRRSATARGERYVHEWHGVSPPEWSDLISHSCTLFVAVCILCGRELAVAASADDDGGHRPSAPVASPPRRSFAGASRKGVFRAFSDTPRPPLSRATLHVSAGVHQICTLLRRFYRPYIGKRTRTNQRTPASPSGDAVTSWGPSVLGLGLPAAESTTPARWRPAAAPAGRTSRPFWAVAAATPTSYTPAPSAAVNRSGLESAPARAGFAESASRNSSGRTPS